MSRKQCPADLSDFIRFFPAAIWYALIFWFSSKNATVSGGQSENLLARFLDLLSSSFQSADTTLRPFAVELLSFPVRKCAHMFLYFVLTLLLLFALDRFRRGRWLTLAACAVLAVLDEYHQTFVPGRSGELRDVLVDLCGCAVALGLWALVLWGRPRPWAKRETLARRWTGVQFRSQDKLRPRTGSQQITTEVWLLLLPFLLLAAALTAPFWSGPAVRTLAENYVESFFSLDVPAQARLLRDVAPIFRDTLTAAACGFVGIWTWTMRHRLSVVPGAVSWTLTVLLSALASAVPPILAALLILAGWGLTAALWGLILLMSRQ